MSVDEYPFGGDQTKFYLSKTMAELSKADRRTILLSLSRDPLSCREKEIINFYYMEPRRRQSFHDLYLSIPESVNQLVFIPVSKGC